MESDPICSSAGCVHSDKKLGYPVDYKVPNFGEEHRISESKESLKWAEKQLGHTWTWKKGDPEEIIQYRTDLPMDHEIVSSLDHL